jgi:hypothetical protein
LGAIFYLIAIRIVNPIKYPNSDFFSCWLAGHMAILGQNPYSTDLWIEGHHLFGASWIPNATYIYPLPLSLFFAPLSLLPLYQAFVVWVIGTQFMIFLSIVLLFRLSPNFQKNHFIFLILAGGLLARPITTTLFHGQLSGFLLLVITCIVYVWERGKWWQGAALLPILALKPNLGVPIIVLVLVYLIQQRKISSLIAAGVSALALLLVGFAQNPNWLLEFWEAGNTKLSQTFGFSPTVWGVTSLLCEYRLNCTLGYGISVCLLLLIGFFYLLVKKRGVFSPMIVMGFAITIMLITTLYTWPYDQLLLTAPVIVVIIELAKDRTKCLPVSLVLTIVSVTAMIMLKISVYTQMEIWNVAIPLSVLFLLTWSVAKDR